MYGRRMVRELAAARPDVEWLVYTGIEAAAELAREGWPESVRLVRMPVRARVKPLRVAYELTLLPLAATRDRVDVLHSFGTTSPLAGPEPRIVTIHDLFYHHFRGDFPTASRLALEVLVPLGARRAHRVQVPSQATKRDVVELCRTDPGRIDVIPHGLGMPEVEPTPEDDLRARLGLGRRPVVLTVSPALPHKNLSRLLEAHAILATREPAPVLVLVGHPGRESDQLRARIAELGLEELVRIAGWVSSRDLEGLYRLAECCAYPSLYEGFGLPPLEAMTRGVPVASSNATSLPEVAAGASELFDPCEPPAIAAAIARLLDDPDHVAELVDRGRRRAREFSWARCAHETIESYERALAGS